MLFMVKAIMQVHPSNILLLIGILFLLSTLCPWSTHVLALTPKPGKDPMFYYPGKMPGRRQQTPRQRLSTIEEEGSRPERTSGRPSPRRHPRLRRAGPRPITPLGFQPLFDNRNRPVAPGHRAPRG
ncbi:uncharacterized protein LOC142768587 [Rhipicephalus microplus]|uniref:uncharacterized protein LOC142768587 n=1 Tax=Rhipicephalus microplus TaxID=6941 RepID=UPI003F6D2141